MAHTAPACVHVRRGARGAAKSSASSPTTLPAVWSSSGWCEMRTKRVVKDPWRIRYAASPT